jgi:hypothetical protein
MRSIGAILIIFICSAAMAQTDAELLIGTWHLESWTRPNGLPACGNNAEPAVGQIIYSSDGYMSAILGCEPIEIESLYGLSREELVISDRRGMRAYFGRYTIDESNKTVTHHVQGRTNRRSEGVELVRTYSLENNQKVVLRTPQGGELVWTK